jgi:uncharacterized protein YndB with AHSA1/START domain
MTTLQIILVILGGLIMLFFLVAFFLPSSKSLSRSITISRPPEEIYKLITDFHNYKKWNPWSAREPEASGEMEGEPGKVGHKWRWDGKKIGAGYLRIKELDEGSYVLSDLVFTSPRKMTGDDIWKFEKIDNNKSKVTWGHRADLGYPVGRYFGLMLDKMLGPDFEQGLKNLKELSESGKK